MKKKTITKIKRFPAEQHESQTFSSVMHVCVCSKFKDGQCDFSAVLQQKKKKKKKKKLT